MTEFTAPVQLIVDTEKLLEQIGWRKTGYNAYGDDYEETGPVDLKRDLASEVAKILAPTLKDEMKTVVREVATEVAQERVNAIIDEALTAGFRKTNSYGEPIGQTITLREMIIEEVKGQLERKVSVDGRPADSYNRAAMTYVEFVARRAARNALDGELGAAADAAVEEVKSKVKAVVADDLGAKIARAVTR
ncbi:hypothetical protein [Nocardia abscessus]|uniref:hypothetical protein n=1 Tax=Nocardia abscessus TaxID=120957 RepID=UPI002457CF1B|nr:hypothetical protein [Nocardia abscessus]